MTFEETLKAYVNKTELYWKPEEGEVTWIGRILGLNGHGEFTYIQPQTGIVRLIPIDECSVVKPESPKEPPYKAGDTLEIPKDRLEEHTVLTEKWNATIWIGRVNKRKHSQIKESLTELIEDIFPELKGYDFALSHAQDMRFLTIDNIDPKEESDGQ